MQPAVYRCTNAAKNGFCTQIGNDWFTWFGTRASKSRPNFLEPPRAGHTDYMLNDEAYGYMRKHGLPTASIACLMAEPETRFADDQKALSLLRKISPVAWQHIHFLGRYLFRGNRHPIDVEVLPADVAL